VAVGAGRAFDVAAEPAVLPEVVDNVVPFPVRQPLPQTAPQPAASASSATSASPGIWASAAAIAHAAQNNDGLSEDRPLPFHWHKPLIDQLYPRELSIPNAITPHTLDRDDGPTPVTYHFRNRPVTEPFGIEEENRPWLGKLFQYVPEQDERSDPERARFLRTMDNLGFDRTGLQMDHVHELQFGGFDTFTNIWPADSSMNMSAGGRHQAQVEAYRQRLGNLAGRWFVIVRISI
jgi:hypothetical protein